MLLTIVSVIYVLVAIAMIVLILMQRGAGAAAGSGFGAGASATVFGARGSANFLSSSTKWLAVVFMGMSLGMAWYATHGGRPVAEPMEDIGAMSDVPAAPAPAPADVESHDGLLAAHYDGNSGPAGPRGNAPAGIAETTSEMAGAGSAAISDEQDFSAVSSRETIESDKERLARNRAQYQVVQPTAIEGLFICPATIDLSSADMELVANEKRSFLLHDALRQVAMDGFALDYILIDCPPSLSLLTVNAMIAADSVLVPLQAEFFALEGLSQLMLTIREVRQSANRHPARDRARSTTAWPDRARWARTPGGSAGAWRCR